MWLKSVEASPTMHSVNSSETPWLLRFTCPRPVREHSHQRPWQVSDSQHSFSCRFYREEPNFRTHEISICNWDPRIFGCLNCEWVELDLYLYLQSRVPKSLFSLKDTTDPRFDVAVESLQSTEERQAENSLLAPSLCLGRTSGCVALEAYDPSEYDPFFLKTSTDCWKVSIPTLQDPLLKDIQRKFIETGIIKQCETGRPCSTRELNELSKVELPPLPLGRQPMDAAEWPKIPHAYIASEAHKTKRLFIERQRNSYTG
ncbi:unnamed protein product [Bubo scandiacus]